MKLKVAAPVYALPLMAFVSAATCESLQAPSWKAVPPEVPLILRDFSCEQEKQCSNNKLWFVQKLNWVGKHDTGRYVLAECVVHTRTAGRAAPVLNAIGGTASTMHGHDAASHRSPCRHPAGRQCHTRSP